MPISGRPEIGAPCPRTYGMRCRVLVGTLAPSRYALRRDLNRDGARKASAGGPLCPPSGSQLLEQRGGAGDVGLAGGVLDVERLHHAVLDQHGVTLRARAEAVARAVERHV